MPYLPVDLDGKKRMPHVARAVGISPGEVLWGLSSAWEEVWLTKQDTVSTGQLRGFFGCDGRAVGKALEDFGFVEELEDDRWRLRGAARWLKVMGDKSEAGRKGGKKTAAGGKSAKNLRTGAPKACSVPPEAETPFPEADASAVLRAPRSSPEAETEALSPNTQHPTPKEIDPPPTSSATSAAEAPPPEQQEEGSDQPDPDGYYDCGKSRGFWGWIQGKRVRLGLARELRPPSNWDAWFAETQREFDGHAMALAFERYLADLAFEPHGWCTRVFMSPEVWRQRTAEPRRAFL